MKLRVCLISKIMHFTTFCRIYM